MVQDSSGLALYLDIVAYIGPGKGGLSGKLLECFLSVCVLAFSGVCRSDLLVGLDVVGSSNSVVTSFPDQDFSFALLLGDVFGGDEIDDKESEDEGDDDSDISEKELVTIRLHNFGMLTSICGH
jgi:hypothetical protein